MMPITNHLKRLIHLMFQVCGYDFLRYTENNFVSLRRARIIQAQKITLVLDVGASEGTYPLELRQSGYRGRIISFEPLSDSFRILQQHADEDSLWSCENVAVGDSDEMIEINISGHITSSSILPISKSHLAAMPSSVTVSKEKVKMVRLDSCSALFGRNENIYLKIDVQGFEKHVLEGATETLKQTRAIELELSLVPMYEGGCLWAEMLDYLSDLGFAIASVEPVFFDPRTGKLLQIDGIFVRADNVLNC